MRVIAFTTQKGGSGKSTLASSLAVAAHEAGEKVFIIDMDPQASLVRWSKERGKAEASIGVETVAPGKLAGVLGTLAKSGVTLAIIDTPGSEGPAAEAAMKNANLCIIPARPNAFDLWASETTRRAIRALRREYVFLLNQCPPMQNSSRVADGIAALESMGGLLSPLITARVDYQDAARLGLGVTEYAPSGDAAQDMRKLWLSIRKRIGKSAAPARKAA
ncbi:ParA family protein [Terrarubrum flagellatum]|uniref:ParA family protein n=1 Tax=Terrirubrum flagellatum TaxID=2895980 RepID=UPI00314562A2